MWACMSYIMVYVVKSDLGGPPSPMKSFEIISELGV